MTDEKLEETFCELRWGCTDKQRCPKCDSFKSHYRRRTRSQFRCRDCGHDFSVTSGTPFAYHKKPLRAIFQAVYFFCVHAAGIATIPHGAILGMTDKSSWYAQFKIREALLRTRAVDIGEGVVQVDGGFFCGKLRDENVHGTAYGSSARDAAIKGKVEGDPPSRKQRRWKNMQPSGKKNEERKKNRRCVLVIREVFPEKGRGGRRTIVTVAPEEKDKWAIPFIKKYVPVGVTIMSDESFAFTPLTAHGYDHKTVKHKERYVGKDGTNDSQAESYFSRFRRSEYGVRHGFRPLHLFEYAQEIAWREDSRRISLKDKTLGLLTTMLTVGNPSSIAVIFKGVVRKTKY